MKTSAVNVSLKREVYLCSDHMFLYIFLNFHLLFFSAFRDRNKDNFPDSAYPLEEYGLQLLYLRLYMKLHDGFQIMAFLNFKSKRIKKTNKFLSSHLILVCHRPWCLLFRSQWQYRCESQKSFRSDDGGNSSRREPRSSYSSR